MCQIIVFIISLPLLAIRCVLTCAQAIIECAVLLVVAAVAAVGAALMGFGLGIWTGLVFIWTGITALGKSIGCGCSRMSESKSNEGEQKAEAHILETITPPITAGYDQAPQIEAGKQLQAPDFRLPAETAGTPFDVASPPYRQDTDITFPDKVHHTAGAETAA